MKKIGSVVFSVLLMAAFAVADQWTGAAVDAAYDFGGLLKEISSSNAYCTLSTTNTKTIMKETQVEPGWIYVLVHDTITGTSASSGVVEIVLQAVDGNNKVLQTTIIDSIVGSSEQYGGNHKIPFYSEIVGHKFKIILQGDTGAQNIFNRLYLYKVRPLIWTKDWK